jgi:hypothetical protein
MEFDINLLKGGEAYGRFIRDFRKWLLDVSPPECTVKLSCGDKWVQCNFNKSDRNYNLQKYSRSSDPHNVISISYNYTSFTAVPLFQAVQNICKGVTDIRSDLACILICTAEAARSEPIYKYRKDKFPYNAIKWHETRMHVFINNYAKARENTGKFPLSYDDYRGCFTAGTTNYNDYIDWPFRSKSF